MDSSSCDIYQVSSLLHSRSLSRSKSGGCNNTAFLLLLGSTSAGRAGYGTDLAECVSIAGDFLRPQGAFPQAFTPFGLGSSPGAWGAPSKGNANGAVGILGKCRARVGYGPVTRIHQKKPCATLAR